MIVQEAKLCAGELDKLLKLHKSKPLKADPLVELNEANVHEIDIPMFTKALRSRKRCCSTKQATIIDTRNSLGPWPTKKPVLPTAPDQKRSLRRIVEDNDWELYSAFVKEWSIDSHRFKWSCGCTPLLTALANGCEHMAMKMIKSGTILTGYTCSAEEWPSCSPLHFLMSDIKLWRCLREFPASTIRQQSLCQSQDLGPIHMAVAKRNNAALRYLLDMYSHPNEGLAVRRRNGDLSELLNSRIGDSHSLCDQILGQTMPLATPLHIAAFIGTLEAANMLLEYGAQVDPLDQTTQTPFLIAANEGDVDMLELLLLHGCDINARDEGGRSASHLVAANGRAGLDALQFLHKQGMDLDLHDEIGETCLSVAAVVGSLDTILFLLSAGCDVMHTDDIGYTPMMHMLDSSDETIRKLALSVGGSRLDAYNWQCGSVLHRRWVDRHLRSLHLIVNQLTPAQIQGLINRASVKNGTPLYTAVVGGQIQSVQAFADLGADLDLDGGRFGSPLMAAVEYGRFDIFKLLVRRGAKVELRLRPKNIWQYPNILRWLLVEQYTEQHKLMGEAISDSDMERERNSNGKGRHVPRTK